MSRTFSSSTAHCHTLSTVPNCWVGLSNNDREIIDCATKRRKIYFNGWCQSIPLFYLSNMLGPFVAMSLYQPDNKWNREGESDQEMRKIPICWLVLCDCLRLIISHMKQGSYYFNRASIVNCLSQQANRLALFGQASVLYECYVWQSFNLRKKNPLQQWLTTHLNNTLCLCCFIYSIMASTAFATTSYTNDLSFWDSRIATLPKPQTKRTHKQLSVSWPSIRYGIHLAWNI